MDKELRNLIKYKMTGKRPHRRIPIHSLVKLDRWLTTKKAKPVIWLAAWFYAVLISLMIDRLIWLVNLILGLLK